jgi:hypothetical protein
MKRFYAKVGEKIEQFNELPYRTYFMYGEDGKDYEGNAMLLYVDHNGGRVLTPIYENSGKPYKRPEYAGKDLKDIDNFKM